MGLRDYPLRSMRHNIGRTALLAGLVALLAAALLGGATVTASLRGGLASLEARLGADVIVVPQTARSARDVEEVLVDGVPGSFYMDRGVLERVRAVAGVEQASPQYFLATAKAGCCSAPLQIIGIEPSTDFTVQPWIVASHADVLGLRDVVVGCDISGAPGTTITFYGHPCTIVARLDATGTALDNAVFCNAETVKDLIAGSVEQGISVLADVSPDDVISAVQVRVAAGVTPESVADSINVHVRGAWAVAGRAMTAGVADGMAGVSGVVSVLAGTMGCLAVAVLVVAFALITRQRRHEFAVLRTAGASRGVLAGTVVAEAMLVAVIGTVLGLVVALVASVMFNDAIESALGLPYLLPDVATLARFVVITACVTLGVGCAVSGASALILSRVDAGQVLREG